MATDTRWLFYCPSVSLVFVFWGAVTASGNTGLAWLTPYGLPATCGLNNPTSSLPLRATGPAEVVNHKYFSRKLTHYRQESEGIRKLPPL